MPQTTLEYTQNIDKIDFEAFFREVNLAISESLGADLMKCKTRARCCDDFGIGDCNIHAGFLYIDVLILEGRTLEMQQNCAKALMAITERYYAETLKDPNMQFTLRIHEMDKPRYFEYAHSR